MALDTRELHAQPPADDTAPQPAVSETGVGVETEDAPPPLPVLRLALVIALPVLAASMMTGGLFVGAQGRIWAALCGLAGVALALRARTIQRPAVLYPLILGGVILIGLLAVVPTGFGNVLDVGAEIRSAAASSDVLRPPVDFVPGWRAIVGWIMATIGFVAAWLAVDSGRPAFGILVTLPIIGLGAISLPESDQLATGLVGLVLFVLSLAVLSGAGTGDDSTGSLGLAFEVRRGLRALPLVAAVTVALYFAAQSDFLFPPPLYDPAQEARKPQTIPLSEVEDRVLFTVEAAFTGPWKMGTLDVYDGEDWRLPPFADSRLQEVPESGVVNEDLRPGVRATFTVRGLGGAILPGLPNTVGIVAIGPTLSYDERTGNIRISQGQIEPGFTYIVAAPGTPTIERLQRSRADIPREFREFLDMPAPPPAVAGLLQQAPIDNRWDRLDFLREHLLRTVAASGAGTPVSVTPERVQDMLVGSREGTPFEIVAAQAMLARWAGIPARIGYGFDGGDPGPGGILEVRPKHGALFLEAFFPEFGWLPLIGDPLQARESLSDAPQQFNQDVLISEDVSVRLYLPVLTVQDPSFVEDVRAFVLRLVPILLGLSLVYYLWPLPYKAYRRARRRSWAAEHGPSARIALAYAEWRDHATDFGYRHHTDTPLMFLEKVVSDTEHSELAWLATRSLWGDMRGEVTEEDALAAEELSRSLRRRLSQAHPSTMSFVAALSRLSVRHPYAPGLDKAARTHEEPEEILQKVGAHA